MKLTGPAVGLEDDMTESKEGGARVEREVGRPLCDRKCNDCPLMREENSRMVTRILNELRNKFGDEVTEIVNSFCPNLTCCFDCHIDDFCHFEDRSEEHTSELQS